jgi:hypothetical protein
MAYTNVIPWSSPKPSTWAQPAHNQVSRSASTKSLACDFLACNLLSRNRSLPHIPPFALRSVSIGISSRIPFDDMRRDLPVSHHAPPERSPVQRRSLVRRISLPSQHSFITRSPFLASSPPGFAPAPPDCRWREV